MNGLLRQPEGEAFLKLAGAGFRDFSRIAAGDPAVWRDIFSANRQRCWPSWGSFNAAAALRFKNPLKTMTCQALHRLINQASEARCELASFFGRRQRSQLELVLRLLFVLQICITKYNAISIERQ
jgi:prephenate dehydrogenase